MPDDGECRIVSTTYPKSPLKKGSLSGKQNQAVTDAACGGFLVGGEQDNFTGFSEGIQNAEFCHYLCAEDGARAQPGETEEVLSKCKLDGKRNQPDLSAGFLQRAVEGAEPSSPSADGEILFGAFFLPLCGAKCAFLFAPTWSKKKRLWAFD